MPVGRQVSREVAQSVVLVYLHPSGMKSKDKRRAAAGQLGTSFEWSACFAEDLHTQLLIRLASHYQARLDSPVGGGSSEDDRSAKTSPNSSCRDTGQTIRARQLETTYDRSSFRRRRSRRAVKGHEDLPLGGHLTSPSADTKSPSRRTPILSEGIGIGSRTCSMKASFFLIHKSSSSKRDRVRERGGHLCKTPIFGGRPKTEPL